MGAAAYLIRHARAGRRSVWKGPDDERPLSGKGRQQARSIARLLRSEPITRIVSSPFVRCVQTVEPLAAALGLEVELDQRLAEGESRDGALALLASLGGGVACTHGDIVEAVLGRSLDKGAAVVVEPAGGALREVEELPAP